MKIDITVEKEQRTKGLEAYMTYVERLAEGESKKIVNELVEDRKQRNLTQQDIADITGLLTSNIARFKKAEHIATLVMLEKYATALGKKIVVTLEDEEE